jgi:Leucine-rich repeat (LRR) protein
LKSILNHAFYGINQANFVDFFENFYLNDISVDSFQGINEAHISYESFLLLYGKYDFSYFELNTLNLAQNNMNTLCRDSIKGTFSQLILDVNSLSHFEIDSFGYLPNLKEISFFKNQIKSLNFAQAFRFVLYKMENLIFKYNKITSIDGAEFFSKFPNLIHMDLSFNNFFELKSFHFLRLFNLKSLHLGNNLILTIESETFDHMTNLTYLDLSNNLLYDLNADLFVRLTSLNELVLRGNKLEKLVVDLTSLHSLDLSFNLIKSFEFKFNKFKNAQTCLEFNSKIR